MSAAARVVRRPVVWSLAVVWLGMQKSGDVLVSILDGYDRAAGAAGRAAVRAGRAAVRALGPLGRLLRGLATCPFARGRGGRTWRSQDRLLQG